MQFLKNLSIKRKLILIVLVTTGAALFLASIALITHDFLRFRSETKKELTTTAEIIGLNSTAALEFADPGAGKEILSALKENPNIVSAAIYDKGGELFTSYDSNDDTRATEAGTGDKSEDLKPIVIPREPRDTGTYVESGLMMIYLPITLDNEKIGTIYLSADMNEVYTTLRQNIAIILIIFLACFLVAFTLSTALQRLISWPILNLADIANRVSESKDFSIRATKESNDESGILVERFNEMLSQIEERDRELQRAQDELEQRVRERTAELRDSQEMLKLVTENIPQAIFWKDVDSRYMGCNKTFASHAGISTPEEVVGKRDHDLAWRREESDLFEEIDGRVIKNDIPEYHIITPQLQADGKDAWVDLNMIPLHDDQGRVVGLLGTYEDITERKMMEEELLRAQKLESLGILAGGIAHDFNNLLTAILGNISLAKSYEDSQDKLAKRLSEAERASLRARDLTQQLLTFAKGGIPIKTTTCVRELLKESSEFAVRGSNSRCEFSIAEDLWSVEVDEGQIAQVINNLVINAKQAMPEGGVVNIAAENQYIKEQGTPSGKRYIMISIEDSGVGIPQEYLSKIFDPYFTTKQEGNGLGLATCYSIIKKHDGSITVESEPGRGTVFKILLPAASGSGTSPREPLEKHLSGCGRILVMDDEELVREVAGEMLSSLGFEVSFAKDGSEAISMYEGASKNGGVYDLVILDLTVPGGIGGRETVVKLIEIDPSVKAIASSGYSQDPVMSDFQNHGFLGFIAKPYKLKELGEVVNRVLQKKASGI